MNSGLDFCDPMAYSSSLVCCGLFHLVTASVTVFAAYTNETDKQALLDIKNQIRGDPFGVLSSWNDSVHFCNWDGVTCGNRHQRVTVLNISALKLVGSLSPSIGNLTFLEEIRISDNFFHGLIPAETGRLFRLQYLRFANNSFEGGLPQNLTRCSELKILDLRGNKLQGRIPEDLSSLSKLYVLSLSRNNFSGNIPPSLGNISSLQILSILRNNLTGNFPTELSQLLNLNTLELSSNKLSGKVPDQFYNLSSIQVLSVTNNLLNGTFPATLGLTMPKLASFLADLNQFHGSIPPTLANASGLVKISIGDNSLTGPIPLNLGSLRGLQVLHFVHNPLGNDRANDISFISTLTNCTELQVLSLSRIWIRGVLPSAVGNLSDKLTSLWLNDNHISGVLPVGIANLVGLGYLDLRNNSLSGNIPDSVGRLTNLQELYPSENNFTGNIPPSLGNISGLQILVLEKNMLTGSIPVSLSNCTDLQGLTLSQNQLSGAIPKEIFSLSSLTVGLILSQNKFTGSLPTEIENLRSLVSLDVSENGLTGEIPITIGGCEMLELLQLQDNSFRGTIPSSLGQLRSIELMDLSRNNFSGNIPASLEKLNFLRRLNLSFNMLEGKVPEDGVFTTTSSFSIVGNKKLCGGIEALNLPKCQESSRKHRKQSKSVIIVLAISIPVALFSIIACVYAVHRIRRPRLPTSTSASGEEHLKITYAQIFDSTNGFSSENLIGEGKYGSVYKGILGHDMRVVAVKVLKLQQRGAHKSFLAECEALRNIRHRNLVKVITSCSSVDFKGNDFKALLFEYVPNGSLDTWLHQNSPEHQDLKKLNLLQRLNIAIDIASALDYLHNHCETQIIHCDLKPSNILIGDDHHALVSDFGLAKILAVADSKSNHKNSSSIGIRGTVGYVAPGTHVTSCLLLSYSITTDNFLKVSRTLFRLQNFTFFFFLQPIFLVLVW